MSTSLAMPALLQTGIFFHPRKKPSYSAYTVMALVLGAHAAVFAAIAAKVPVEQAVLNEPMMVSLVNAAQPQAERRTEPEPVKARPPVKLSQAVKAAITPPPVSREVAPPAATEASAEPVKAAPRQEAVAEAATAPVAAATPAATEPEPIYQPPRFGVAYLHNPSPDYPPLSRRLGEQGRVLLRVMVTAAGEPASVELDKSSGFERLDQAAMQAVKQWRFVPAKRGELAVTAWVVVPLRFSVEG